MPRFTMLFRIIAFWGNPHQNPHHHHPHHPSCVAPLSSAPILHSSIDNTQRKAWQSQWNYSSHWKTWSDKRKAPIKESPSSCHSKAKGQCAAYRGRAKNWPSKCRHKACRRTNWPPDIPTHMWQSRSDRHWLSCDRCCFSFPYKWGKNWPGK